MLVPTRNYSSPEYRYGFNGMEKDDKIKGNNNSYDFGARMYDPRVSRWLSGDPVSNEYVSYSSYNFAINNPINAIDPDGKRIYFVAGLGYSPYRGNSPYVGGIRNALTRYLNGKNTYSKLINGSRATGKDANIDRLHDALYTVWASQRPRWHIKRDKRAMSIINGIVSDIKSNPINRDDGEELNLVGTSQGSVSIAQASYAMLKNPKKFGLSEDFKIDNLVLAGSPIDINSKLYKKLKKLVEEKGGTLHYADFQAPEDLVTGLGGKSRIQAIKNGIPFMKVAKEQSALFEATKTEENPGGDPSVISDPHIRAAYDLPVHGGESFSEEFIELLKKHNIDVKKEKK